jgi:hypothetical protein
MKTLTVVKGLKPALPFLVTYSLLICLARNKVKPSYTGRYTWYTYCYTLLLWLLPKSMGRRGLWFASHSTLGCFLGIEWIWYVDDYKALWELGRRHLKKKEDEELSRDEKKQIVLWDLGIHTLPFLLVLLYFSRYGKKGKIPLGSGVVTGAMHVCYCFLITGGFDPTPLYRVKPRSVEVTMKSWAGVFASHLIAEGVSHLL